MQVNFDPIQEIGPKVWSGQSFARLQLLKGESRFCCTAGICPQSTRLESHSVHTCTSSTHTLPPTINFLSKPLVLSVKISPTSLQGVDSWKLCSVHWCRYEYILLHQLAEVLGTLTVKWKLHAVIKQNIQFVAINAILQVLGL